MTVRELYRFFNEKIPLSLSCEWDNDGLMCCPDDDGEVRRVLVTLDVTDEAVCYAIEHGFDLIVSHHPLIFRGLRAVNPEDFTASKTIRLIRNGISVMSFHTRLDAVTGGVNDVLAERLGLCRLESFGENGIGRIGQLAHPMTAQAFALLVKQQLQAPSVVLSDAGLPVRRVAVLGGGGSDDVEAALAAGADTYVTGELKYHQLTDAPEMGINLLEAGHFHTENPICEQLRQWLLDAEPSLMAELFHSCALQVV